MKGVFNRIFPILIGCSFFSLSFLSCEKSETSCNIVIRPTLQMFKDSAHTRIDDSIVIYGFYADTSVWEISSFEDAAAGIITNKSGKETQYADFVAYKKDTLGYEFGPITSGDEIMIIACDLSLHDTLQSRIYGWRRASVVANLAEIKLTVLFCPWRTDDTYENSKWRMVNENPPQKPVDPGDDDDDDDNNDEDDGPDEPEVPQDPDDDIQ